MAKGPITDAERAEIARLHGEGKTRNAIAATVGRAMGSVTKVIQDLGKDFVRGPGVIAATEAKRVDAKARRAQLQLELLAKAEKLLQQIDQPALAYNFGGRDNTYEERTIDEPTFADKRNILQGVSVAVNTSIKIDEHDRAGENLSAIDAWLVAHIGPGE